MTTHNGMTTHDGYADEWDERSGGDDPAYKSHTRQYVVVAVVLAVVTAIEVFLSYIHLFVALPHWAIATLLILGMIIKFFLVAAFFMHLKGDSGLFKTLFIIGIVAAMIFYLGMLFSFNIFTRPFVS